MAQLIISIWRNFYPGIDQNIHLPWQISNPVFYPRSLDFCILGSTRAFPVSHPQGYSPGDILLCKNESTS